MATWKKVIVSGSGICELDNETGFITSGDLAASVSGSSDAARTNLNSITADETAQLLNIDSVTISNTQWGYLGGQDQSVATTAAVQFTNVTASLQGNVVGNVTGNVTGTADSASVLANARAFTTTGDVVLASANFDGSANFTTTATIQANAVDSDEIADGAIDPVHFSTAAGTAVSGAFTAASSSIATDIAALTAATYDLDFAGDSGTGTITNAETFTVAGGTNLTSVASGNGLTVNLDANINLNSVTASLQGNVVGNVTGNVTGDVTGDVTGNADTATTTTGTSTGQGLVTVGTNTNIDLGLTTTANPTFADLTVTGNLTVEGTRTELNVANLNVEDQFILLNSGSTSGDSGIIFGGTGNGVANAGHSIFIDDSDGDGATFGFAENLAHDASTGGAPTSKLGNIESSTSVPSSAPTFQGVGTIHIKTDTEDIYIYS